LSLGVDTRFTTAYTQRITQKMQSVIRIFDTSPGRLRGHLDLASSDVERPFLAEGYTTLVFRGSVLGTKLPLDLINLSPPFAD